MSAFEELATRYEALATGGHKRALASAALDVQAQLEAALAPHHRTGTAEGSLHVTPAGAGLSIEQARYEKYIKGIPKGEALKDIAVEAYNKAVAAEIGGGK